jgi:hypothetical protein
MAQFSPEIRGSIEGQVFQKKAYQLLYNPRVLSKSSKSKKFYQSWLIVEMFNKIF